MDNQKCANCIVFEPDILPNVKLPNCSLFYLITFMGSMVSKATSKVFSKI